MHRYTNFMIFLGIRTIRHEKHDNSVSVELLVFT